MELYLILGERSQPFFPYLLTKEEAEAQILESGLSAGLYRVELPWGEPLKPNSGGRGNTSYPCAKDVITMRVPREIRDEVKAYAEWRSQYL